jgi:hypothetical protein
MHVAIVPSRQGGREYKAYLLRQTYRDQGNVKHRTLANLSMLPLPAIEAILAILKGQPVGALDEQLEVERSLPHGQVLAVLGMLRQLGLDRMLASRCDRQTKRDPPQGGNDRVKGDHLDPLKARYGAR